MRPGFGGYSERDISKTSKLLFRFCSPTNAKIKSTQQKHRDYCESDIRGEGYLFGSARLIIDTPDIFPPSKRKRTGKQTINFEEVNTPKTAKARSVEMSSISAPIRPSQATADWISQQNATSSSGANSGLPPHPTSPPPAHMFGSIIINIRDRRKRAVGFNFPSENSPI